jgi:hypothetical protein
MTVQADTPLSSLARQHCAACGRLLTGDYYMIVDREEKYCPHCIATRPRCDNCGAPIGANSWRLHDERLQCARCHSTAVYDIALAQQLYHETVSQIASQLGMVLHVGVAFRMVDAPMLRSIRAQDHTHIPTASERTLGLYQRQGRLRAIYLLYGLPRLLFRTTVAHEYAHAWQGEYCPLLDDIALREGHAEWVAYRHLDALGCTRATERMLRANHPYRPALEHMLALERRLGTAGLIAYMRRAE